MISACFRPSSHGVLYCESADVILPSFRATAGQSVPERIKRIFQICIE